MSKPFPGRPARRVSRWVPAVSTGVAVAVAIAVVMAVRSADGPSAAEGPRAAYGVSHVHGLGVDPGDEALLVATHHGLFRIAAGASAAEPIGATLQDTMGFTIVGPGRYFASGHPDLPGRDAGQPAQLGLIETNDAGQTWASLSLSGEADLHAISYAHDQVYGWDAGSGRFMVSADGLAWDNRSTTDLYSFAVDPADADHILAAGPQGLVESADGGRVWLPTSGPSLVALSWHRTFGLWGLDAAGTVYQSLGADWLPVGRLAAVPQVLLAAADGLYAAVEERSDGVTSIYRSADGEEWTVVYGDGSQ